MIIVIITIIITTTTTIVVIIIIKTIILKIQSAISFWQICLSANKDGISIWNLGYLLVWSISRPLKELSKDSVQCSCQEHLFGKCFVN